MQHLATGWVGQTRKKTSVMIKVSRWEGWCFQEQKEGTEETWTWGERCEVSFCARASLRNTQREKGAQQAAESSTLNMEKKLELEEIMGGETLTKTWELVVGEITGHQPSEWNHPWKEQKRKEILGILEIYWNVINYPPMSWLKITIIINSHNFLWVRNSDQAQ